MKTSNRQAIIQELRHQLRYSTSNEERIVLNSCLEFWLNQTPKPSHSR